MSTPTESSSEASPPEQAHRNERDRTSREIRIRIPLPSRVAPLPLLLMLSVGLGVLFWIIATPVSTSPTPERGSNESVTLASPREEQWGPEPNPGPIRVWRTAGGDKIRRDVIDATNRIAGLYRDKAGNDQFKAACGPLGSVVQAAQAYPPIPDPEAQRLWSDQLSQAAAASAECLVSIEKLDTELMGIFSRDFSSSVRNANNLNDRMAYLDSLPAQRPS